MKLVTQWKMSSISSYLKGSPWPRFILCKANKHLICFLSCCNGRMRWTPHREAAHTCISLMYLFNYLAWSGQIVSIDVSIVAQLSILILTLPFRVPEGWNLMFPDDFDQNGRFCTCKIPCFFALWESKGQWVILHKSAEQWRNCHPKCTLILLQHFLTDPSCMEQD